MAKPALRTSDKGLLQAQEAFSKQGFTQESLADQLGCNRSVINKFFNGDNVWDKYFISICEALGIDSQEVVYGYIAPSVQYLVEKVRTQIKELTKELCGTMRILDMTHPMDLSHIYTDVNILEKLTALRRITIDEFKNCKYENFDRFGLGKVVDERVLGVNAVEKYQKLIVLGKPGAGKTTFLRYLAIQSNQGNFLSNLVPIFIPLKYFAETPDKPSLFAYISQQYSACDVTSEEFSELFKQGSALILLDGLDEVSVEDQEHTLKEVRNFSRIYFENHFVIACRIASWDYTFDKFTEIEIADFDDKQINEFANNWFRNKEVKASDFIKSLNKNNRIYQLAVTPLLLTLQCLVFEEYGKFQNNRSEIYREALFILLKKWDAKRGIHRDQPYEKLSSTRKEDLLREIAYIMFEKERYFFTASDVKHIIDKYLKKILNLEEISNFSQIDIEDFLNFIEAQHGLIVERAKGIYSFSHLTFHEYFVATRIVSLIPRQIDEELQDDEADKKLNPSEYLQNEQELQKLVKHLTKPRWREIFLLVTEILPDAEKLARLMKEKTDEILASNHKLQEYLIKVKAKSQSLLDLFEIMDNVDNNKFAAAVRAFCFDIDYDIDQDRQLCFVLDKRTKYLTCGNCFTRIFADINSIEKGIIAALKYDELTIELHKKIINADSADAIMKIAVVYGMDSQRLPEDSQKEFQKIMSDYFEPLDNIQNNDKIKSGADKVREIASKKLLADKLLGASFKDFDRNERDLLKTYYYANKLLVDCLLQTDCLVNNKVRENILGTLFLSYSPVDS